MNKSYDLIDLLDWDRIFHSLKIFKYEEDASKAVYKIKRNMEVIKARLEENVMPEIFTILKQLKIIPQKSKPCSTNILLELSNVPQKEYVSIGYMSNNKFRQSLIKDLTNEDLLYCYKGLNKGDFKYKIVEELLIERGAL